MDITVPFYALLELALCFAKDLTPAWVPDEALQECKAFYGEDVLRAALSLLLEKEYIEEKDGWWRLNPVARDQAVSDFNNACLRFEIFVKGREIQLGVILAEFLEYLIREVPEAGVLSSESKKGVPYFDLVWKGKKLHVAISFLPLGLVFRAGRPVVYLGPFYQRGLYASLSHYREEVVRKRVALYDLVSGYKINLIGGLSSLMDRFLREWLGIKPLPLPELTAFLMDEGLLTLDKG